MFASANDQNYERVYRSTTSEIKGMYLKRLQSRGTESRQVNSIENLELSGQASVDRSGADHTLKHHQRAHSFSTAAATTQGFYRSRQVSNAR